MKKLIVFFLICGCSNLEFVYKTNQESDLLDSTRLILIGDQFNIVNSEIKKIIGQNSDDKFSLNIETAETITNEVVASDSTTQKYKIKHTLIYTLKKIEDKCVVLQKKITTMSNYDSKSAGYNFGSDVSKATNIKTNIQNNINEFTKILETVDIKSCKNES